MGTQEQVYLAQLLPTLVLATVVLSCVWRRTRVDCYRENMFTLRDELFDYMWRNGLSFDLRAYRLMREYLNGSIRIADALTPLSFIALLLVVRRYHSPDTRQIAVAISEIEDARVREHFERVDDESLRCHLKFLGLAGLLIRATYRLKHFRRWSKAQVDRWSDALLAFGNPDADRRRFTGLRPDPRRWRVAGH